MKRIVTFILSVLMVFGTVTCFASCGNSSDWAAVQKKGYFICGVTDYKPMNYKDDNGEWTGFDTEFAQAVAKELGVEVKFQSIEWESKYAELNSGSIDLIWNGFTLGMESDGKSRTEYVDFTHAYLENRQCVVTRADRTGELSSKDAFKGKTAVAEGGSSGQSVAEELAGEKNLVKTFTSQASALMELLAGNADFAVIDYQMANAMVGKDSYTALAINNAYEPESEVYAIGCRKGSDLTAKINEAIVKLSEDGTLAKLAEKYSLTNDLIANIGK